MRQGLNILGDSWMALKRVSALVSSDGNNEMSPNHLNIESDKSTKA